MLCRTMHCQWGRKPPTLPFPWDFITLPEEDRATAIGNMHKKFRKDRACCSRDILADRQTHTDILITILRSRSRGRSNFETAAFCTVRVMSSYLPQVRVQSIMISVPVCLFVCLYVGLLTSLKHPRPNFTRFSVHVNYRHGSVLL